MAAPEHVTFEEFFACVRAFARTHYPALRPRGVIIELEEGEPLRWPLPVVNDGSECSHAPDFASVTWYGRRYTFSPPQAVIVGVLWGAWEAGNPEVGGNTLMAEAQVKGRGAMSDLFGDHSIWRDGCLVRVGKSSYRLQPPEGVG